MKTVPCKHNRRLPLATGRVQCLDCAEMIPVQPMKTVTLRIKVSADNEAKLIDAVNETLNELARNAVLNDAADDAWAWGGTA